ncbi:SAUR-like auxin-responsive protein family [Rhynchospora pubera]|uniref:SAUR-like auxin-responsive protein family n=1 Tax=Rhynchospora pubera TaxID=906938 RepID=A0AAV8FJ40_9POAL|nr:SAUR-like auxin-responsive protein family [Rhynchospora pubera]KAJ4792160.1 SAUR-like auxin-responsive protein family [Rhynchospora pubera]
MKLKICYTSRVAHATHHTPAPSKVPPGHVPVHVGEATEPPQRFTVRAEMLNRPIFVGLLERTAQELGFQQTGALRILCTVSLFQRLLLALSSGGDGGAVAAEIFSGEVQAN